MRGFFGVAVWHPKTETNVGTLWRSANIFGAAFLAVIGGRYRKQSSDTMQTHRHVPLYEYETFDAFLEHRPRGARLIAVEFMPDARSVVDFGHPEQAIYLLGPEDGSLPASVLRHCNHTVVIPGERCLNLAVAGSIVMYDRIAKGVERSRRFPPHLVEVA